jgi:hypothetical protein
MLEAFFSVQMAFDAGTRKFAAVKLLFNGQEFALWKATIGTCVQANKDKFNTASGQTDFVNIVESTLEDRTKTALDDPKGKLDSVQIEALHQVIEMLSLIDEPR